MKRRILFSVIEIVDDKGETSFQVDWHQEMYPVLDEISPHAEITDHLIDIAKELCGVSETDDDLTSPAPVLVGE